MPSTEPPTAPACRRIRSPTRNGRALSSTIPAIRLPSVCWAARPKMTAVKAPPDGQRLRLDAGDREREQDRHGDGHQPNEESDRARGGGVHTAHERRRRGAADIAGQGPAEPDQGDDGARLQPGRASLVAVVWPEDPRCGGRRRPARRSAAGSAPAPWRWARLTAFCARFAHREAGALPGVAAGLEHPIEVEISLGWLETSWHSVCGPRAFVASSYVPPATGSGFHLLTELETTSRCVGCWRRLRGRSWLVNPSDRTAPRARHQGPGPNAARRRRSAVGAYAPRRYRSR